MMLQFANRAEAFEYLRSECPSDLRHIFDNDAGPTLLELLYQALTSEKLLSKLDPRPLEPQGAGGYGAYIRKFGIAVNQKKGALQSCVLLVDVLLTNGVAAFLLSQVMKDPIFVRRLTSNQHLACLLGTKGWEKLTLEDFRSTLNDSSSCKHVEFDCRFRQADTRCGLAAQDFSASQTDLRTFFELA